MTVLDPGDPDHARVLERLRSEIVIWLTTVRPDGQPQSVPVWFLWEDGGFLVYSQPGKPKLRNVAGNPKVSLHLRGTETGGEVAIFEGQAELADGAPPADRVPAYIEKYEADIRRNGWAPGSFAADYSQPLRVTPTTARIW